MYTCTRKIEFDAGHRVPLHQSKCKNLHGHRYVAEIKVCSESLTTEGFVIDFGAMKDLFKSWIDENWDHGMILQYNDEPSVFFLQEQGMKRYLMRFAPTVENMVVELASNLQKLIRDYNTQHEVKQDIKLVSIRLYETPNCWADWECV